MQQSGRFTARCYPQFVWANMQADFIDLPLPINPPVTGAQMIQGGSVTAPAQFANIALLAGGALSGISDRKWLITVTYWLTGTTETTLNNIRLVANGVVVVANLPTITGSAPVTFQYYLHGNNINGTAIQAANNSTGGSQYNGIISALMVG